MSFSVKPHLPLISPRIKFQVNQLPPPPHITLRQEHGRLVKRQIRRKQTPYAPKKKEVTIRPEETDSESALSSFSEDESSDNEAGGKERNNKIPKPPGEAGRRYSGGFNLEKALGWNEERYNNMIKYVNNLVNEKLDPTRCFTGQKPNAIKDVIEMVTHKFKIEDVYDKDWPIREALKLRLKYTSESQRKRRLRKTEQNLRKAVMEVHDM